MEKALGLSATSTSQRGNTSPGEAPHFDTTSDTYDGPVTSLVKLSRPPPSDAPALSCRVHKKTKKTRHEVCEEDENDTSSSSSDGRKIDTAWPF